MPSAILIFNHASGSHLESSDHARRDTVRALREAGVEARVLEGTVAEQIRASLAAQEDLVVIAGGDGTIRATIEAHQGRGRPFGIIPGGTMNLLAADCEIPTDRDEAARVIAAGHVRPVDYGLADGHLFLHTAFTGLPVRIGVHREHRRGRMRLLDRVWLAAHAVATLARDPIMEMTAVTQDGGTVTVRSKSFVVIVGTIEPQLLPRPHRDSVTGGRLTVFSIHPESGIDVARLLLRGAVGDLAGDPDVDKLIVREAAIRGPRRRLHAMLDGEDTLVASPCRVEVVTGQVSVLAPPAPTREKDA